MSLNKPETVGSTLNQPQIAYVNNAPESSRIWKQYANYYFYFGISQVVLGLVIMVLQIVFLCSGGIYVDEMSFISDGIWCGAIFVAAGILGIISGLHPTRCTIIAGMVLSTTSALFATTMLGIQITAVIIARLYSYGDLPLIFHSLLNVLAFIELIVAILHASYCCAATCCRSEMNVQTLHFRQAPDQMQPTYLPGQPIAIMYSRQLAGFVQSGQQPLLNCQQCQAAHLTAPAMEMPKNK